MDEKCGRWLVAIWIMLVGLGVILCMIESSLQDIREALTAGPVVEQEVE